MKTADNHEESSAPARDTFHVEGMDCADEVAALQSELAPLVGGAEHLGFDVLEGRLIVRASARPVAASEIVAAVARTGMRAAPWRPHTRAASPATRDGRVGWILASAVGLASGVAAHALSSGSLALALGSDELSAGAPIPLVSRIAYAVAIGAGLWLVVPKAVGAVRRARPDMNLLMTIAVMGALAIDQWLEAATVSFLFAAALGLESWSVGRARRAIAALSALAPTRARVRRGTEEVELAPDEVRVGDRVIVRAGERFAVDGLVREGSGDVNQAPITGESAPVPKRPGSEVFAGSINGDAVLAIEATKLAGESMLARIAALVSDAQSRRGPSERWVERFAAIYTPTILAAAALVTVLPPLVGGSFADWVYRALVLLVVGCPCSLVISTPVTIVAAMASAARHGVLLKSGEHVESPARIRAVALDKTGTVTEGAPAVVEVIPLAEHDERELLALAMALEQQSTHPLARAVVTHCRERGMSEPAASDTVILQGRGATGTFRGRTHWLGSHRLLEERGQETAEVHQRIEALAATGASVVVFGNDAHVCGLVALRDRVRDGAPGAVRALRAAGVAHVVMLTGDNEPTAVFVAGQTGVDEVLANLLPADKVTAVEALARAHGPVAMVGDGVNDAPALARASLGVAMGAGGTDVALETADVALMSDDLSSLAWLIGHSRRAVRVIRQNVVFSLGVKAVFVVLAMSGHATLWAAIAADMGASLLVTFNGLRLLRAARSV